MSLIGIRSTGVYLPYKSMTSVDLTELSGITQEVIEDKMGMREKPIPGENDHTAQMGIFAAEKAIDKADIDSGEIDLVIYIGEEHKEYLLWTYNMRSVL